MTTPLAASLLAVLVLSLVGALRYLNRFKHLNERNTGSAAERYSPRDPGSQYPHAGGV
jgi:hypothetical protein